MNNTTQPGITMFSLLLLCYSHCPRQSIEGESALSVGCNQSCSLNPLFWNITQEELTNFRVFNSSFNPEIRIMAEGCSNKGGQYDTGTDRVYYNQCHNGTSILRAIIRHELYHAFLDYTDCRPKSLWVEESLCAGYQDFGGLKFCGLVHYFFWNHTEEGRYNISLEYLSGCAMHNISKWQSVVPIKEYEEEIILTV